MQLMTLADAIERHVRDGQSVALEGFTHLIPFAAGHEIIRQRRRNLHLIRMTPESGTVGTRPNVLPLSIGDGELAETAACVVPLPEVFAHYLQRGRVEFGFLGAAQIDRYGNLNSTVIGNYSRPTVRLPGGGGAPEIATYAREVLIVMKHSPRSVVSRLDFRTSCGYLDGSGARRAKRCPGRGPQMVITDLGVLRPHPETDELQLAALYPGGTVEAVRAATGWPLQVAENLEALGARAGAQDPYARTRAAHSSAVRLTLPVTSRR